MIKPGDKIHVEYVVDTIEGDGFIYASRKFYNDGQPTCGHKTANSYEGLQASNPCIVKHIPKPPEPLKVGERVRHELNGNDGTILHLFEDRAWVKFDDLDVPLSPLLYYLKRIES